MKKICAAIAIATMTVSGFAGPVVAKGNNFGSDQSKFDSVSEQGRKAKAKSEASSSFDQKKSTKKRKNK